MKKVKVAVVGIGSIGKHHVRNYFEIPEAELVAIADINEKAASVAEKYKARFYQDFQEMLEKEDVDAVSVAVPTNLHATVALEVIKRGKHLLIEKPIAATLADAKRIIEAARGKGIKLSVGHLERFNPVIINLKELMKSGELGEIISINVKRVGLPPVSTGGMDVITDLAIHDIDIINYLLGEVPIKVSAVGKRAVLDSTIDSALIQLTYPSAFAQIETNWVTPVKIRILTIAGTKGYAELNYITQDLEFFERISSGSIDTFGEFKRKLGKPKHKKIKIKKVEPLKNELDHFIKSILGKEEMMTTGEEALVALKTALLASAQIKTE